MGRHDDAPSKVVATFHDTALNDGKLLNVNLDSEVAARDHDEIGGMDDIVKVFECFLVLELGDELCVASGLFDLCS